MNTRAFTLAAEAARPAGVPARAAGRVESIDVLRGAVMILMALDHVRDFFGTAANPTDLAQTTPALFFTRWITHFCAPTFFVLTGVGAWLARRRRTTQELSWFLLTRGLWLILLELTLFRCLGYQFNFDYRLTMLVILWALGWSMITLAALVYLPPGVVAMLGTATIALHNLLDPVRASSLGTFRPLGIVLHEPNLLVTDPAHLVFVAYPLVPWIGVTALGYGIGQVFSWPSEQRRRALWRFGTVVTVAFVALRFANEYGDPIRWAPQRSAMLTVVSFLNTNKYPPSLLFLMMTLGPAALVLWMLDSGAPRAWRAALAFGKVPLFYFLLHMPLIHLLAVLVCYARYGDAHWMFESPTLDRYPVTRPPGWGYSLPVVYLIWIGVVVALYPLCRWFAGVKHRRAEPWLSYL